MKKSLVVLIVIMIFIVGCVDYKAYDIPNTTNENTNATSTVSVLTPDLTTVNTSAGSNNTPPVQSTPNQTTTVKKNTTVVPQNTTTAPTNPIESLPNNRSLAEATIKVKENELVKIRVNYSDPDRDPVTLTFNLPLDKKGEWQTQYGDAGEYQTTITASDGKLSTATKLKIIVERVNVAPIIEGIADLTVKEGETIRFEPKVTDPNKDPFTITISEPLKSGVFKTDHTSAGDYNIKVVASDGDLSTDKTFLLRVQNVNVKPKISNFKDISVKEGETVVIKPTIEDLDEDKVKVEISDPIGNDGIWETRFTDHGEYTVTIIADDGKEKVSQKISLIVQDINMAPEIVAVHLAR